MLEGEDGAWPEAVPRPGDASEPRFLLNGEMDEMHHVERGHTEALRLRCRLSCSVLCWMCNRQCRRQTTGIQIMRIGTIDERRNATPHEHGY